MNWIQRQVMKLPFVKWEVSRLAANAAAPFAEQYVSIKNELDSLNKKYQLSLATITDLLQKVDNTEREYQLRGSVVEMNKSALPKDYVIMRGIRIDPENKTTVDELLDFNSSKSVKSLRKKLNKKIASNKKKRKAKK